MIVDKPPLLGDEVELSTEDAPPSYDALDDLPVRPLPTNEKAGPSTPAPAPPPPPSSSLYPHDKPAHGPGSVSPKAAGKLPWFTFGPSFRAVKGVRATLSGLLRDLVKNGDPTAARGVLESCADACQTYDLSLPSILQEPSLEGHSALYWAVVNRPAPPPPPSPSTSTSTSPPTPTPADADGPDLVTALLTHAAPLTDATVDELRLACLHTTDNGLFQRLRRTPAFAPLSGKEEIIMGGSVPVDDVEVLDVPEDEGAFVARFRIPLFQKRMRVSESIALEFIAKGRMWELSLIVAAENERTRRKLGHRSFKTGSWVLKLALLSSSPPTVIDSRFVIDDPRTRAAPRLSSSSSSFAPSAPASPSASTSAAGAPRSLFGAVSDMVARGESAAGAKVRPPVEVRLRSAEQLTAPRDRWDTWARGVIVALEGNALANSLQYQGCPYLEPDGALVARLEARLAAPGSDAECVIC
ncbi:uncharacterized protein BXZ73DRAFT_89516 [Epithele typhae]|uniref:uncharacterized protein n=1 Tax=Epithele typhae TaxID=378194 RepID=UPI002007A8B8|nr:uncharacterized protein BXZ73DRAFT_89516 [Epithele typhae]KAH9935146.1 hypothetical protein BXZ73DRAFT_89516 [Epithele typhae]